MTEEGNLEWQNCLTEKNRFFFDDSDGLFTNYKWTVATLPSVEGIDTAHHIENFY